MWLRLRGKRRRSKVPKPAFWPTVNPPKRLALGHTTMESKKRKRKTLFPPPLFPPPLFPRPPPLFPPLAALLLFSFSQNIFVFVFVLRSFLSSLDAKRTEDWSKPKPKPKHQNTKTKTPKQPQLTPLFHLIFSFLMPSFPLTPLPSLSDSTYMSCPLPCGVLVFPSSSSFFLSLIFPPQGRRHTCVSAAL